MFFPNSLSEAISLAKLQEEKFTANTLKLGFNIAKFNPGYRTSPTANHNTTGLLPTPTHVKPLSASPSLSNSSCRVVTPVRKLTTTDLQARREKGLCYYYVEKYARGHRCKKKFYLLIAAPEIPSMDDELNHLLEHLDLQVEPSPDLNPDPHITLASLNAHISIHKGLNRSTNPMGPRYYWQINCYHFSG